jgi:hypothetical protein
MEIDPKNDLQLTMKSQMIYSTASPSDTQKLDSRWKRMLLQRYRHV